jgi:GGDEF domain-containing protein
MVSIGSSLSELERSHQVRAMVLDCYVLAIKNIAHYAIHLDEEITAPHRAHVETLASEVATDAPDVVEQSRGTLRALLRDYRDKAHQYLSAMRDELAGTVRALQEILDSLAQTDGDHEKNLQGALRKLRQVAAAQGNTAVGVVITTVANSIESSLEQLRKQHQLTTSQFVVEIQMLHKRIDSLEAAASVSAATRFATRDEMTERIRATPAGQYCLLLVAARGLRRSEIQFGKDAGDQLHGAFAKRLTNSLPTSSLISQWGPEEFAAMLVAKKSEAMASAKWVMEHLSGAYTCLIAGKAVRPVLQVTVGVIESSAQDTAERIIERVSLFLVGQG